MPEASKHIEAIKALAALESFGGEKSKITAQKLASPGSFITFGQAPLRVDILATAAGIDFDQCYNLTIGYTERGETVRIITARESTRGEVQEYESYFTDQSGRTAGRD